MCGPVVAPDRPHQGSRRAFALQVIVVVREIFYAERHVGMLQERLVLIAMKVEGRNDERAGSNGFPDPPRQVCFGPWDAAHGHRPVQAEIDTVERACRP